jgi:hypothetical protein
MHTSKIAILCLLLLTIIVGSNLTIEAANSTISKPSVPEFTLRYVDRSYAVGATYDIDIYTGMNVTTHEAYYVQLKTIELTIKNQAFTEFKDSDNHSINLYYSVRMKGHSGGSWTYPNYGDYYVEGKPEINYVRANTDSVTVITYGLVGNNGTVDYYCFDIPAGGRADFQVQAFIGYYNRTTFTGMLGESHQDVFTGESSDWSDTQTITVDNSSAVTSSPAPSSSTSASQNPTLTVGQPSSGDSVLFGLGWIGVAVVVLLALIAVLLVLVVFYLPRRR